MKYLEAPELAHLSEILEYSSSELRVHTRFEAYSCKSVSRERKLFKSLETAYSLESSDAVLSMSPEIREAGLDSCFGRLDQKDSRQTWFWLIALLNVAFPDHDFTGVRPDHFVREPSVGDVLTQLSTTVLELSNEGPRSYGSYPPTFSSLSSSPISPPHPPPPTSNLTHPHLHKILDQALQGALAECDVYSYTPDIDSDPHAESDSDDDDDDVESRSAGDDDDDEVLEGFSDDDDDEAGGFRAPGLDAMPLVGGSGRSKGFPGEEGRERRGCLWSVNYFFVSRRQKRILFISIWAKKRDYPTSHHHHHSHHLSPSYQAASLPTVRRKSGGGEKGKDGAKVKVKLAGGPSSSGATSTATNAAGGTRGLRT